LWGCIFKRTKDHQQHLILKMVQKEVTQSLSKYCEMSYSVFRSHSANACFEVVIILLLILHKFNDENDFSLMLYYVTINLCVQICKQLFL